MDVTQQKIGRGSNNPPASEALTELTVLDLTRVRAGPTCTRQFADWGANVIKVELPESENSDFAGRNDSDFQNLHRDKRGISLNLKHQTGREILRRLVARADILVENFRPDVKFRLGIDYETLKTVNPRLIYTSISGFGQDGPYRERPGVDQIAQGIGGIMSVTGEPGRGPMRVGIPIADLAAGLFAALGTFVALMERERSGEGQWVQSSLLQAQAYLLDLQAARWLVDGEVPGQAGNSHPTGVPTGMFKSADIDLNIAPTPAMWPRFCKALGREEWIDDPRYATRQARWQRRDEVEQMIAEMIVTRPGDYWIEHFNRAGIPCGPINTIDKTFADPQVRQLGLAQTVTSAALGELTLPGQPIILSRTPSRLSTAAPAIGEHNAEVLGALGYSPEDIERFRSEGVI